MTARHHWAVTLTNCVSLVLVLFLFHRGLLTGNKSQVRNSTPQPLWHTDTCFLALFPHRQIPVKPAAWLFSFLDISRHLAGTALR